MLFQLLPVEWDEPAQPGKLCFRSMVFLAWIDKAIFAETLSCFIGRPVTPTHACQEIGDAVKPEETFTNFLSLETVEIIRMTHKFIFIIGH